MICSTPVFHKYVSDCTAKSTRTELKKTGISFEYDQSSSIRTWDEWGTPSDLFQLEKFAARRIELNLNREAGR